MITAFLLAEILPKYTFHWYTTEGELMKTFKERALAEPSIAPTNLVALYDQFPIIM